jgi:hypothetical protein
MKKTTPLENYAKTQNELMLKLADGIISKQEYVYQLSFLFAHLLIKEKEIINKAYSDGQNDRLKRIIVSNYFEEIIKK